MTGSPRVRYAERGSSWWPLLWGPSFALLGLAVELSTPGPLHLPQWLVLAVLLAAMAVPWVLARRRFRSVRLTTSELTLGGESVPLRLLALPEEPPSTDAARVLGGGGTVPRGMAEVPLLLHHTDESGTDAGEATPAGAGTVVLAWAADPERLRAELVALLRSE
ncbi:hypothetical protein CDG81_20850 [Actinopolyspora erythraea]|uniref:DUF3093 domain-containing protein n=1 Tax=Actinopolyspora erythraea TaxID=414996 RepID=A0A099D9N3_9ACTN|nr:hypothetical protein [Actinopolyspora erythraea]ASU80311.1 hypothetical protein CDG81_20850 [Actinopolyspora erythraea]KGI82606.1 hypothetical protein IL38_04030 [Actinopolyspora erythraea]